MRVMTYNIRHGLGNESLNGGGIVDLERIASVIRSQNPDIVAIQEVDRFWARSNLSDQPADLARILGMDARFAPNLIVSPAAHDHLPGEYGVLVLSKLPINSSKHERFPVVEHFEPRGFIEVRIGLDGVAPLAVFCTHLEVGNRKDPAESVRLRAEQAGILASRVSSIGVPSIVMGDFNAQSDDQELAALLGPESPVQDAWAVAGGPENGMTIPASPAEPANRRIDFILASRDLTVSGA